MAVLPTPGSPISTGLFLVRRCSTWMARRISSSRPITGSSLPRRARSVRSSVYFLSASRWPSASATVHALRRRAPASIAASSDLRDRPLLARDAADVRPCCRPAPAGKFAGDELVVALEGFLLRSPAAARPGRGRPGPAPGPRPAAACASRPRPPASRPVHVDAGALQQGPRARLPGATWPPAGGPARCRRGRWPRPGSGRRPGPPGTGGRACRVA